MEVFNSNNNCARGDGSDHQVGVFVSIPSRKSSRVGAADTNPRIIGNSEHLVSDHRFLEISKIPKCQLRIEQSHVLHAERILPKRQRLPIEAMLKRNDDALKSLGEKEHPLTIVENTITVILSADDVEDRSDSWTERIRVDPVSLVPVRSTAIIIMVSDLIEPMHLTVTKEGLAGL